MFGKRLITNSKKLDVQRKGDEKIVSCPSRINQLNLIMALNIIKEMSSGRRLREMHQISMHVWRVLGPRIVYCLNESSSWSLFTISVAVPRCGLEGTNLIPITCMKDPFEYEHKYDFHHDDVYTYPSILIWVYVCIWSNLNSQ